MADDPTFALASAVIAAARAQGLTLGAAESCTGGLVCGALTEIAGSSSVLIGGIVSYANSIKSGVLGVPVDVLEAHGAVSQPTARAMAEGARRVLDVDLAVSITGIAGPGGGSVDKPVGLVHFATALNGAQTLAHVERYPDKGREAVRAAAVKTALELLLGRISPQT